VATVETVLLLILGLEIKHFVADYTLQFGWMIKGKRSLSHAGGYVHAGIHAVGSLIVLLLFGFPAGLILILAISELVVHYLLDFAKARFSDDVSSAEQPRKYWALNGLDQLLHHITYIAMAWMVVIVI
jgi:hypothetical protein